MDRSDFLKTLGFGGAAIITAPSYLTANEERGIDKYEMLYKKYLKEFRRRQEKVWLYGHLN